MAVEGALLRLLLLLGFLAGLDVAWQPGLEVVLQGPLVIRAL